MAKIAFANRMRDLKFDVDAMLSLEVASGKNTTEILGELSVISFNLLILALWAGLKHEDPKLTVKAVKQQLDNYLRLPDANLKALREAVGDAIRESNWYQQLNAESGDDADDDTDGGEDDEQD